MYGKSCCLRSAEKESLSDGLSLQIALLTNISPENKVWYNIELIFNDDNNNNNNINNNNN